MDEHETNILFDFTRKFREGGFLLNEPGDMVSKDEGYPSRQRKTDIRRDEHGEERDGE